MNASPRKSTQVTPGNRPRHEENAIGSSASSELLVPAEAHELDAHHRDSANARRNKLVTIAGARWARGEIRQDVDHEVRPLGARRSFRAQHDHPDEQEARPAPRSRS